MAVPQVVVTFDRPLVVGILDAGNWSARVSDILYQVTTATALRSDVTLTLGYGGPSVGPNVVSYDPPPNDVLSRAQNLPAIGFTDFPIA